MMLGIPILVLLNLLWRSSAANSLPQDCELARAKCAYRTSCYKSLHGYMVDCADVLAGRTTRCPWACQRALISLTSTEHGHALSTCDCGDNDFCRKSKDRIEVCRPEVAHATADDTVVSCSVAKWICAADTLCSTALDFYHRLCRPMFHGRKCTPRCNNSLAILDRQDKASKLRDCYCDGTEDFPCHNIKRNTQRLCYGKGDWSGDPFFTATTSRTPSGSNPAGGSPCLGLLLCLVVFAMPCLVMFRTGGSRPNATNQTNDPLEIILPERTVGVAHRTRYWPWWWMSEVAS